VALDQLETRAGLEKLELLLAEAAADHERAAVHYEMWRLDKQPEDRRRHTAELYSRLYANTPNRVYRQRYQELTGQTLPDPPPLPELPAMITARAIDPALLLTQVDQLLAEFM
jgi:hypothetical protein